MEYHAVNFAASPDHDQSSILSAFKAINKFMPDIEFSFSNVYRELPIVNNALLHEINDDDSVQFKASSLQLAAIHHSGETVIQAPLLNASVVGKLTHLDASRSIVSLRDFSYAKLSLNKRMAVRVQLVKPINVLLSADGRKLSGMLNDISLGGCKIVCAAGMVLEQAKSLCLHLEMFHENTVMQADIPCSQQRIEGNCVSNKLALVFDHSSETKNFLSLFIFKHQHDIIHELKQKEFPQGMLHQEKTPLDIRDQYAVLSCQMHEMLDKMQRAQQGILTHPEDLPEASFAVCYRPVLAAGGDFYDVILNDDDSHSYFVADISGHDLEASFSTSALKAIFRQSAEAARSPLTAMRAINRGIVPFFKDGMHLTASLVQLDRAKGVATLVNAGHLPVIHQRVEDGSIDLISTEGDILGIFDEVFLTSHTRPVAKGDRLFLYTDGLVERSDSLFERSSGIEAVVEICRETRRLPIDQAVQAVIARLFGKGVVPEDDIILLGIEV